jgi:ATP-binding cassette subfamily F protein 3
VEVENGTARDYHGDYEYYLWKKVQEVEPIKGTPELETNASHTSKVPKAAPTAAPRSKSSEKSEKSRTNERRDATKALTRAERQIAKLEEAIAVGEKRIQARDQELAGESLYQDHQRWTAFMKEREHWVKEQSVLTSQWAGLCEEAEQLRARLKELEPVL